MPFVASFRAEKKGKTKEREHEAGPSEAGDGSVARQRGSKCSSAQGPTQPGETVATQPEDTRSEDSTAETTQEICFQPDDIARALESASFSFGKALLLPLNGIDDRRAKQDAKVRFR